MKKDEYRKMFEFENDYWWYRGLHDLVEHYVVKLKNARTNHGPEPEPLKIFDAGCGTGRMMELLQPYGMVEGIDYSEDAVNRCGNRGLANARIGDLNTWNPSPEAYHVIISNDVICSTGVEDDMAVVEKFYRALKPDGFLILNLPAFKVLSRKHDIAVFVKRRYRKRRTLKELRKIGFVPVRAGYRLPLLFFLVLLKKHLVERFSKKEAESDLKPISRPVNFLLLCMNRIDNSFINAGIPLFVGSSLFLVCKKGTAPYK